MDNRDLERLQELLPNFLEKAVSTKYDRDGNELTDEEILALISAREEDFSDLVEDSNPCETCGSHGTVKVSLNGKQYCIEEW